MIKKYKIFKESLLDKLSGPSDVEILNNLENKFSKRIINLQNYLYKCEENKIQPNKELVFEYLKIDKPINNMDEYFDYLLDSLVLNTKEMNDKVKDNSSYDEFYYFKNNKKYYLYKNRLVIVINENNNNCTVSYNYFRFPLDLFGIKSINEKIDIIKEKLVEKGIIGESYNVDTYNDAYLQYN